MTVVDTAENASSLCRGVRFQSLLLWMTVVDAAVNDGGGNIFRVSILVVVDDGRRHRPNHRSTGWRQVSILVVVDDGRRQVDM